MSLVKIHDKYFKPYISSEQIALEVRRIAAKINEDYYEKNPLIIAILNGSFMFAADLFREIKVESEICFVRLSSYVGTSSSENVLMVIGLDQDIKDRHIIVLEDIVDTGKTLHEFVPQLLNQLPSSLKIVSLLHKPEASLYNIQPDYVGFVVPDKFLLGYGLDYKGLGRNFNAIFQLVDS